jgi:hypothetical protein
VVLPKNAVVLQAMAAVLPELTSTRRKLTDRIGSAAADRVGRQPASFCHSTSAQKASTIN